MKQPVTKQDQAYTKQQGGVYDIIVAGSGPAGLLAAITAAREGAKVLILERKEEPCKKLYATGNGRCNFTNLNMEEGVYRGGGAALAEEAVDTFDTNDLIGFFQDLGLMTKHIGDYVYPYNEQAGAVAGVLLAEIKRLGVGLHCSEMVTDIVPVAQGSKEDSSGLQAKQSSEIDENFRKREQMRFSVVTQKGSYRTRSVILAPGGKASPSHGSDGSLNKVIRRLGHTIINQNPALVPLLFSDKSLEKISGVRVKSKVTLWIRNAVSGDGKAEAVDDEMPAEALSEQGEIQFTKDTISGIPVMQLSRYAVEAMEDGSEVILVLDFFPEQSQEELTGLLKRAFTTWGDPYRTPSQALSFLLPQKLAEYICDSAWDKKAVQYSDQQFSLLADHLKAFPVKISGNAGFNRAQVTMGGADCSQITDKMESVLLPGLYFAGEILDVDGTCGGYNLHFAFASGRIAGRAAAEELLS